jgi:hypothetical protein
LQAFPLETVVIDGVKIGRESDEGVNLFIDNAMAVRLQKRMAGCPASHERLSNNPTTGPTYFRVTGGMKLGPECPHPEQGMRAYFLIFEQAQSVAVVTGSPTFMSTLMFQLDAANLRVGVGERGR